MGLGYSSSDALAFSLIVGRGDLSVYIMIVKYDFVLVALGFLDKQ